MLRSLAALMALVVGLILLGQAAAQEGGRVAGGAASNLVAADRVSTDSLAPDRMAGEVDRLLAKELAQPASPSLPVADDEVFLRRVTLDLVGQLPTPEQVSAFVLDPSPQKRVDAVARLLDDPRYGENWARYWRDVMLARRSEDRALIVAGSLVDYLTEQLNDNSPWDAVATAFITASGDVLENGDTAIIMAQQGQTEETAAEISRIFLGVQIQCAQCHDHVTDRWKREQFHQFAAFFPRIGVRPSLGGGPRSFAVMADDIGPANRRKMSGRRGMPEHYMPDLAEPSALGTQMEPVFFLTGETFPTGTPDAVRRAAAAGMITGDPWFAKALVNRLWSELVGEGFYEPVDDMGPDHAATAPETLEYLAAAFRQSGCDVKWLLCTITSTAIYQQQSRPRRIADEPPLAATCPQRLRADQLFSALMAALELPEPQAPSGRGGGPLRALRSPRNQFALVFGYDPSAPRDELAGSIQQALAMMNLPQLNAQIDGSTRRTMLGRLLADQPDDAQVTAELYLRCLAREPSERERALCLEHVERIGDRQAAFEDLLWTLLNSTEFLHRR